MVRGRHDTAVGVKRIGWQGGAPLMEYAGAGVRPHFEQPEPVVNGAAVLETAILGDFLLAIGSASDTTPVGRHENE